ncbi:hypothetical protein UFOVP447_185 [uncultured Caudovirales phage]|uniref:Uncharacterized protein n=1 Tax=uncultured Caudovirales phage TaxID=2100421 RepID=A0A6J5MDZ5_9CAUD|nr:hypothetical protein UFOVP447_185 [uncultured Caudovirales phage]
MAQWGTTDNANNSTLFAAAQVNRTPNTANRTTLFNNVTTGAFQNNGVNMKIAVGQFGVSAAEATNTTGEGKRVAHAGWNLRTRGTGPLTAITVAAAGRTYANSDTFSVAAGTGGTNATGNVITNAVGNVVSFSVSNWGANFNAAAPTVTITTSTGTGASLTATAGGRAGRIQYETLVAMGSITGDATDDTLLPE